MRGFVKTGYGFVKTNQGRLKTGGIFSIRGGDFSFCGGEIAYPLRGKGIPGLYSTNAQALRAIVSWVGKSQKPSQGDLSD